MVKKRIVVGIDPELVAGIDELIDQRRFVGRGEFVEEAVSRQFGRLRRDRLAEACLRLDPDEERGLAEEGMGSAYLPMEDY